MLMIILRAVIGIVLSLVIAGAGLFGYIALKAGARKWGSGMIILTAFSVLFFYWFVLQNPFNLVPL
ncbi:MAG: hypothetical protein ABEJ72_03215 [Candidatus Aenigmatarchaeota archaeon]